MILPKGEVLSSRSYFPFFLEFVRIAFADSREVKKFFEKE
jgi:hypothetical protein